MRADAIWFIQDLADEVVACFTVKHEMVSWLTTRPEYQGGVYRIPDGGRHPARWVDPGTLEFK